MRFEVTDRWRIESNKYCWCVQRYRGVYESGPKLNQPKWENVKYYSTLSGATKALAELMIREAETTTLPEAIKAVERVAIVIEKALAKVTKDTEAFVARAPGRIDGFGNG